ncbi:MULTISPECIES: DUF1540 domain-containing protein [Brevibacillus]|uniref:DUF1540 domain-containing protein n=1 Tax=Brevibacillus porteri TaxID=2126350 RepID=A0ABX5FNM9_9BACL|nr:MULTISPECIES: DUF1540 domain-containing protein [Brevibacillus]MDC0761806.1 DUF1540 domain-containing protein [Brevibacillus sp. AG]MED1802646.1 DUF1540 domain-containing protein [Brevibacillus porteri]MED2131171.1 DUF1540 domain-containing protein [Brevibacillus porteri]MED2747958.1 DUF1540 domain-containing protein [Brevibacillus porteri]MED2816068.1 DUF1540 domain-containing protein [Brevibacillus porteri]
MPAVKCSVANCEYWAQGNLCSAEEIMVEIDAHATVNVKEEFAGEYGQNTQHQDQAKTSSETCCLTFKPKTSAKK